MTAGVTKPQLLIHESEAGEIIRMIDAAKDSEAKIVGNLFGLWRNSLSQPVVQLVAGPGRKAKISRVVFSPDHEYHHTCKRYLNENHGLLQIGLWLSGSVERYPKLNPNNPEFRTDITIMPNKGKYAVLLFVNTGRNLTMDYYIIDRRNPRSFTFTRLRREDILPGKTCFRSLDEVSRRVEAEAKFPSGKSRDDFSRNMLTSPADGPSPRGRSEPQWYESDRGGTFLAKLLQAFQVKNISVEMSRNANSHDMTFELDGRLCLHFPKDFPYQEPLLSWVDDRVHQPRNADEICDRLVRRVIGALKFF